MQFRGHYSDLSASDMHAPGLQGQAEDEAPRSLVSVPFAADQCYIDRNSHFKRLTPPGSGREAALLEQKRAFGLAGPREAQNAKIMAILAGPADGRISFLVR